MLVYCEENLGGSTTVKPIAIKSKKDKNTNTCRFDSLCIILFHADKRGNTRCYYINILRMVDIIFLRSALQLARCPQFTIQSDRQSSPAWFVARLSKHWLVTVLERTRGVYTIQGGASGILIPPWRVLYRTHFWCGGKRSSVSQNILHVKKLFLQCQVIVYTLDQKQPLRVLSKPKTVTIC